MDKIVWSSVDGRKEREAAAPGDLLGKMSVIKFDASLEFEGVLVRIEPIPLGTPLTEGMVVRSYGRWLSWGVVMGTRYTRCEFPDAELEMAEGPWFFGSFRARAHLKKTREGGTSWGGITRFAVDRVFYAGSLSSSWRGFFVKRLE